jgi:hypothetical protein
MFRIGYAYEMSLGPTVINSNTHELMLSLKISREKKESTALGKKGKKKK